MIFKDHFSTLTNQVVYKFTRCIQENKHFYAEKDMFVEQTDVAPQTKMSTEHFFLFSIKAEHFYFIQSISNFSRLFWLLLRTFFTLCFKSAWSNKKYVNYIYRWISSTRWIYFGVMALHACFEQSVTFDFQLEWIKCGKIAFENLKEFFF